MNKLAAVSLAISVVLAAAAAWALQELKSLEKKVAALESPVDAKTLPPESVPPPDDPRAVLASRLEALERRLDESDSIFGMSLDEFRREADKSKEEIDLQTQEVLGQLAAIRANPNQELTDALLEERIRAGLFEKRKKDLKKLVKKEGTKNLKKAKDKLNLTEAQMEELKKFFEAMYEEWSGTLAKIFAGEEIPQDELDVKVKDTVAKTETKMKEVLTPEQYTTWEKELKADMFRDPFRGGGGGGGGGGSSEGGNQ